MFMKWWTQRAQSSSRRSRREGGRGHSPRRRVPLRVEMLEDRRLLSAGALDSTFGNAGVTTLAGETARAVAVEGDGKIVVLDQSAAGYDLHRFNPDGSANVAFGADGSVAATFGPGTSVVNLAVLSDGHIVVAGGNAASTVDVARFNDDGSPDAGFGTGGVAEFALPFVQASDMAVLGDGRIVVAATSNGSLTLLRIKVAGQLDSSFGAGGIVTTNPGDDERAGSVSLQSDGKIVATAFSPATASKPGSASVLRYNTDGSLDAGFGNDGVVDLAARETNVTTVRAAVATNDGKIVVAVHSVSQPSFPAFPGDTIPVFFPQTSLDLFRLNDDGSPDATFGANGQANTAALAQYWQTGVSPSPTLALQTDGKILVGALQYGSSLVARYDASGALDLSFGNGGVATASSGAWYSSGGIALALQGDGKVVVASNTSIWQANGVQTGAVVARLEADSDIRPVTFGSADAFKQYLIDQAVSQYRWELGLGGLPSILYATPLSGTIATGYVAAAAATTGPTYSQTNVQVQGVDESDTVKSDGQYLYVLANGKLVILNAWPAENLQSLSTTSLEGKPVGEYLDGDRLTVITDEYQPGGPLFFPAGAALAYPYSYWSNPVVHVTVFDVSNRTAPTVVRETTLDGSYNNSRAIGDTVYVAVTNNFYRFPPPTYTQVGYETDSEYRAQLAAIPLDQLMPQYTTHYTDASGGHDVTGVLTAPEDVYQPALSSDNTMMSLVAFDVAGDTPGPTHSASFMTSYGATLYAAPDNFYLITTRWSYVNNWTFIDKLSLQDGGIQLTATGRVPGTILNQFSVGEQGQYLDIATTTGWWSTTSNNVYVLAQDDQTLNVVGSIENLAPGEKIYSVRFMGDRGFVSTFRRVDPLFALDLSDPTDPRVAGQLEASGYTSYLQGIDATHLIGIGAEVDPVTNEPTGVEISLFDVTNLNAPTLVSRYDVQSSGWWWSQPASDYHAITYYPEFQTLTLPVTGEQWVAGPNGVGSQWVVQSDQLVFHLNGASGELDLKGEIGDSSPIHRGVFIGNVLYSISDTSVQAHALDDLGTQMGQVQLPAPQYSPFWWRWIIEPLVVHVVVDKGPLVFGPVGVAGPPDNIGSPDTDPPGAIPQSTPIMPIPPGVATAPAATGSLEQGIAFAVANQGTQTSTISPASRSFAVSAFIGEPIQVSITGPASTVASPGVLATRPGGGGVDGQPATLPGFDVPGDPPMPELLFEQAIPGAVDWQPDRAIRGEDAFRLARPVFLADEFTNHERRVYRETREEKDRSRQVVLDELFGAPDEEDVFLSWGLAAGALLVWDFAPEPERPGKVGRLPVAKR